jgi:spermidine/putrescine transport system substrate-binding protein
MEAPPTLSFWTFIYLTRTIDLFKASYQIGGVATMNSDASDRADTGSTVRNHIICILFAYILYFDLEAAKAIETKWEVAMSSPRSGSQATLKAAARFSRRLVLKSTLAAASISAVGPWIVKDALSSSGELVWFTWDDYTPKGFSERFTKDTGIDLKIEVFTGNEDALNKMRASGGEGYDLVTPGLAWVSAGVDFGFYEPLDLGKVTNYGKINPALAGRAGQLGATRDGKTYAVPFTWSTEALGAENDIPLEYGKASYGILWDPQYKGKVMARGRTLLLSIGLWMESSGKMKPGTMLRAYDDEAVMKQAYGETLDFAIKNKEQIGQFWLKGAEQKAAFLQNGCVIGLCWDSILFSLQKDNQPYRFLAPNEGALTVMDTHAVSKGAKNVDQAYALINWTLQPEIGGLMTSNVGYNSVVDGAQAYYSDDYKRFFSAAFPGDAVQKLFIQGTEHPWFIAERQRMVDKLLAA